MDQNYKEYMTETSKAGFDTKKKILVYGFGNPGRQDDGLGPALAEKLEQENIEFVACDSNYQLNIEDAHTIADCDSVIFVDASIGIEEPFSFYEIEPANEITFTTHAVSPQSIMALAYDLYKTHVKGYILEIRGETWEFDEGLSKHAQQNFDAAYIFIKCKIKEMTSHYIH